MKLKDEYLKLPKEMLYETYLKIVYKPKDYDNITRNKMLEEIIKEYNQENYLYHICTRKELDFLKYISKNKLSVDDIKKYEWEIKILNEKCIFSKDTLEVFEEQKQNVQDALKTYEQNNKKGIEDIIIFMISKVKTNAIMLTKALTSMIESMYNIDEKGINSIMGSPLFHFYCEFNYEFFDFSKQEEELVSYRDYYNILDELKESRKIYGIAGSIPFDIRDDFDTFYYGFPIRKEKIKKMYNEINKRVDKEFLFQIIDEARVLNNRMGLDTFMDNRLLEVVNEALDECPCAAMNGFTPNEYNNQLYEELDLDKENVEPKVDNLIKIEETIVNNNEKIVNLKTLEKSMNLAKELLQKAYEKMKNTVTPKFTENLSKNIHQITDGKYTNVMVQDDNGLVVELENGNYVEANRLSVGTIDQLYLSLRLSMTEDLSSEKMPIILDEAFAYYDTKRLENILNYLANTYPDRQIILFTCTEREKNIFEELHTQYHLIEL